MSRTVFITGATGFIGQNLVKKLIASGDTVLLLARSESQRKIAPLMKSLPKSKSKNVKIINGNLTRENIIDDPADLQLIQEATTDIYHLAALHNLVVDRRTATAVNIKGTQNLLSLAKKVKNLKSLNHVSSIAISGDFNGTFYEYTFDEGQRFSNWYAWSKFESEKLVRECWGQIPTRIFRPGVVVGDSKTGEINKVDILYSTMLLLSLGIHLITSGADDYRIHVVPVDFVADTINYISRIEETTGKPFSLINPNPPTYPEFINTIYEKMEMFKPIMKFNIKHFDPIINIPMESKVVKKISRLLDIPAEEIPYLFQDAEYDTSNTAKYLAGSGIKCCPFNEYTENIVKYFLKNLLLEKPAVYFIWKRGKSLRKILSNAIK
ncbi:MAG TPA: SDR family oxidoreductase [bacterium]